VDRIAVLASGGLDSSVLLADEAKSAVVYPIYVRCGLAWEDEEWKALNAFVNALSSPNVMRLTTLSVPVAPMYGDHWSVGASVPGADEPDTSVFLPGRNILLIGLAAVWCSTHNVDCVGIGSLGGNPFPDASIDFFQSFASALSAGLGHSVKVKASFRDLRKSAVIKRFEHLPLELTLSCMAPTHGRHCGQCNKCSERQVAFERSGVADLTGYVTGRANSESHSVSPYAISNNRNG
jgi:7-cyano-7-deazaguanine synthase